MSTDRQGEIIRALSPVEVKRKLYLESYGCQMNFSDSEIVASILADEGFGPTSDPAQADLILLNTCSIREKAEQTIRKRLIQFRWIKKKKSGLMIGILGCMAERLKSQWLEQEKIVDLVVGPDAYRDLPDLINSVEDGRSAINVILSKEETYADINPVRLGGNAITAFVTIMRGCDNMCTFCVVPFTRGRERSRDPHSIVHECQELWKQGYKEVTLLGQNVDSYLWYGGGMKKDFSKASSIQQATAISFAGLLDLVACTLPEMRIRFSTSNPYDMSEKVLKVIARHSNICKYIHLPVQSGSTRILKKMNRRHTREQYMELIDKVRQLIPNCAISYDMIAGFCGETQENHLQTLSLMEYVRYDFGYMFAYSVRPGTPAERQLVDDVPESEKKRRLQEIVSLQQRHSYERMQGHIGKTQEVLIEGVSKKNSEYWYGRNSQNAVVVFPKESYKMGDLVKVYMDRCTSATLIGKAVSI
ncbi:tRNA (N6-isopentenyl adenosine(37)-C2)-methylthiotransferase MiaB [Bacteroidetes bacterium endosymbiont of Geopemphigus sp.]|uniref:tRNA (N6-isopentenyl adenosine(37)-C2)-methylthiotransferase MiaB n=1 Tax=Bacteroidetes bacterium endosymbiont of Geopemphigus sp. TaxID=2047937 RepID=UPI000CD00349|nr:tRNA (N6-isopentenyl adenosine(37)-C2)-methylthiotransferase MiaB [Bacteroidetes bacterium endosymbiont of Geopemphigus sp.]